MPESPLIGHGRVSVHFFDSLVRVNVSTLLPLRSTPATELLPWVLCPLGLVPPLTDKGVCKAKVSNPLTVPACPLDLRIPHPNGPGACAGPLSGAVLSRDTAELRPERGRVALFLWGAAGARPCPLVWACSPRGPSGCAEQVVGRNGPGGGALPTHRILGRTPRSLRVLNSILAFYGIGKLFVKVGRQNTSYLTFRGFSNLKILRHAECHLHLYSRPRPYSFQRPNAKRNVILQYL